MKKNIVIIGGGNGSATIINALKKNVLDFNLTAIVGTSDSNGSSGAIRKKFKMLPPSDIMRATLAMSPYDYYRVLRPVFFKNRLSKLPKINAELSQYELNTKRESNLGNLVLAFLTQYEGDFVRAVEAFGEALEAVGRVLPNTLATNDLCVELENGKIVKTEGEIDRPNYDRNLKIKRAWLEPNVPVYPEAAKATKEADFIILCPGSLFTSVVAGVLPKGLKEAIAASKAKLLYIAGNAYEQVGETGPTRLTDIVATLEKYLPRPIDTVLCNTHKLTPLQKKHYAEKQWGMLDLNIKDFVKGKLVATDFESKMGGLSPDKLRAPLLRVIQSYGNKKRN